MAPSYKQLQRKKARYIRSETNDKSLNKSSILNVPEFLNSRSFEINELHKAQLNSKFSASTRVFQSLPRKLRRRTASHNVKRIPKRLRKRAIREMQGNTNDNEGNGVVIKKRKLPIKGKELYRLKMRKNLLALLTSMNQEQRKIIDNKEVTKLNFKNVKIRSRIKEISQILKNNKNLMQTNNEIGSFDNTGYNKYAAPPIGKMKFYKRQRDFTWLSTHVWHAKRAHMIKQHGFQIPLSPTQKLYKLAHRNFHYKGAMIWDKSYVNTLILSSDSQEDIMGILEKLTTEKIGKRYLKNGGIVTKFVYASNKKLIGPIEIVSLHYKEQFNAILRLHPSIYQTVFDYILEIKPDDVFLQDNRYSIGCIELTGPNSLKAMTTVLKPFHTKNSEAMTWIKLANEVNIPDGTLFTLQIKDPRLVNRKKVPMDRTLNLNDLLIDMKMNQTSLNEQTIEKFITPNGRSESYKDQLSLKSIGKLKATTESFAELHNVANFPVIIYKMKNIWKILIPWYWVLPIWQPLTHIAHLNFGGVLQERQLDFEKFQFNFPKDYHFTEIGFKENEMNGSLLVNKWTRKPKSKRFNYERLILNINEKKLNRGELGDWSKCDWRYLQLLTYAYSQLSKANDGKELQEKKPVLATRTSEWDSSFNRVILQLHDVYNFVHDIIQYEKSKLLSFVPIELVHSSEFQTQNNKTIEDPLKITSIKLQMVKKGNLRPNARIYSIPSLEKENYTNEIIPVPHSKYLIGFVTSANYNLLAGANTGVGFINTEFVTKKNNEQNLLLVRNSGTDVVRVAKYEEVTVL